MTFFKLFALFIYLCEKKMLSREKRVTQDPLYTLNREPLLAHQGPKMQTEDNKQLSAEYFRGERARALQLVKTFWSPPNTAKGCNYSRFKTIFCGRSVALVNFNRLGTQLDPLTRSRSLLDIHGNIQAGLSNTEKTTGKDNLDKFNLSSKAPLIIICNRLWVGQGSTVQPKIWWWAPSVGLLSMDKLLQAFE